LLFRFIAPQPLISSFHSTPSHFEPLERKEKHPNTNNASSPPTPTPTPPQSPSFRSSAEEQIESSTRAIGQVTFLNSTTSGRIVLASLALGDPTLAAFAALGAITSTSAAHIVGLDAQSRKDGLWGYNGALVGCAASAFGGGGAYYYLPYVAASTMLGAAATPVVSASLKGAMPNVPQWTWSFNIVALTMLLRSRPLSDVVVVVDESIANNGTASSEEAAAAVVATASSTASAAALGDALASPLAGISQIFVVDSPITGAGILVATHTYSPKLAMHALGGSAVGCLVGLLSGAPLSDVSAGLWGYNSALASMAVGVFFVESRESLVLSGTCAAAAASLFGGLSTAFGTYGAPCLTLPFCAVASAAYLLEGHVPGLRLAKEPHSPEKNC